MNNKGTDQIAKKCSLVCVLGVQMQLRLSWVDAHVIYALSNKINSELFLFCVFLYECLSE